MSLLKKQHGFSFIEIVISLFIFSLTLMGFLRLNQLSEQTLKHDQRVEQQNIEATNQSEKGFTLIELLIALLLSSLLLLMIYQLVAVTLRVNQSQLTRLDLINSSRFLHQLLIHDVHQAGYFGCHPDNWHSDLTSLKLIYDNNDFPIPFPNRIYAIHANDTRIKNKERILLDPNSDVLVLTQLNPSNLFLEKDLKKLSDHFVIGANSDIKENDLAAISDCDDLDLISITKIEHHGAQNWLLHKKSTINLDGHISKLYQKNAIVNKFNTTLFYLKKSKQDLGRMSLYEDNTAGKEMELLNNVTQFNVSFSSEKNPTIFYFPQTVNDWVNIRWVKINVAFSKADKKLSGTYIVRLKNE